MFDAQIMAKWYFGLVTLILEEEEEEEEVEFGDGDDSDGEEGLAESLPSVAIRFADGASWSSVSRPRLDIVIPTKCKRGRNRDRALHSYGRIVGVGIVILQRRNTILICSFHRRRR